jgi:hypothetical protein
MAQDAARLPKRAGCPRRKCISLGGGRRGVALAPAAGVDKTWETEKTVKKLLAFGALLASLAAPANAQKQSVWSSPWSNLPPELQKGAGLVQDIPPQTWAAEPARSKRCATPPNGDYYGESFFGPRAQQAAALQQYLSLLGADVRTVPPEFKAYVASRIADKVVTDACGNECLYQIRRPVVLQRAGRRE